MQTTLTVTPDQHILVSQSDGLSTTLSCLSADGRPIWALARLKADGSKDPSFQGGFIQPFGLTEGAALAARWTSDGGVLIADYRVEVAGDQADMDRHTRQPLLVKFRANGRFDSGFGSGGRAELTAQPSCVFTALAVDPAGRPLAAEPCRLARFTPGGAADPAFSQRGRRLGGDPVAFAALQSGGRIVLGGAVLGSESDAAAYIEQWPPGGQPDSEQGRTARLDLTTFEWPGKPLSGQLSSRVAGLLFNSQDRLVLLLSVTTWDKQGNQQSRSILLRFAAPLILH